MSRHEAQISLMSWNVNGLKKIKKIKRKYVAGITDVQKIIQEKDIVFLQETHIGPNDRDVLKMFVEWKPFFTVCHPSSKGAAILIKKDFAHKIIESYEDSYGRYNIVKCIIQGQVYTLVNVYNHKSERDILEELIPYLQESAEGVLVIGGDFNTTLNPYLDKISTEKSDHHAVSRSCVDKFTESFSLVDVWRRINPTEKNYTYPQDYSKSRLDYIFMQEESMWRVKTCEIHDTPLKYSDHKPVFLKFTSTPSSHGPLPDTDLYFLVAPLMASHLEKLFKDMTAKTKKAKNETKSLLVIHPERKKKIKWSLLEEAIGALKAPIFKSTLCDKLLRRSDQDPEYIQLQPDCPLTTALLKLHVTHFMRKVQTDELFPSGVTTGILIYGETVMMSLSFKAKEKLEIRQSLLEETGRRRQDLIAQLLRMQDEDEDEDEEEEDHKDQEYVQLCCDHPYTPGLLTLCVAHLMSKVQTRGRFFPTRPKIKNLTDNETVMISVSFK